MRSTPFLMMTKILYLLLAFALGLMGGLGTALYIVTHSQLAPHILPAIETFAA